MTPVIATIISVTIFLFLTILGVALRLERRFNRLEGKIERLREGTNQAIGRINGIITLLRNLIGLLAKRAIIDREDVQPILQDFADMARVKEISTNPLSRNELVRLNKYIRKAKQGEHFTRTQVLEYDELVAKLEEERPEDPNIWPLVALAAFLLGLYLRER